MSDNFKEVKNNFLATHEAAKNTWMSSPKRRNIISLNCSVLFMHVSDHLVVISIAILR